MADSLCNGLRMTSLRTFGLGVLGAALLAAASPANAQAMTERLPPGSYLVTQSISGTECMCRANGTFYNEGEQTCLRTAEGRRLALCNKVINMLNWAISDNPCPES